MGVKESGSEAPATPGVPAGSRPTRAVWLPEEIVRALEQRMRGSSFDSVDTLVAFILGRLLDQPGEGAFSAEDERLLKERLRSLGYID